MKPSGKGRTKGWKRKIEGTVERVTRGSVFVQWDNIAVVDEMEPRELVSLNVIAETIESPVGEMLAPTEALENLAKAAAGSTRRNAP